MRAISRGKLDPALPRLTGYSLACNLGLGVAGGTSPMIPTWFISVTGFGWAPGAYFALAAVISGFALWGMKDRSHAPWR